MNNPDNSPMCAVTATCAANKIDDVVRMLHLKPDYLFINLRNWHKNLCYGLHIMEGGQKSYTETGYFFDWNAQEFQNLPQAVVFVKTYVAAHTVAWHFSHNLDLRLRLHVRGSLFIIH
jgi:hypothetical protein